MADKSKELEARLKAACAALGEDVTETTSKQEIEDARTAGALAFVESLEAKAREVEATRKESETEETRAQAKAEQQRAELVELRIPIVAKMYFVLLATLAMEGRTFREYFDKIMTDAFPNEESGTPFVSTDPGVVRTLREIKSQIVTPEFRVTCPRWQFEHVWDLAKAEGFNAGEYLSVFLPSRVDDYISHSVVSDQDRNNVLEIHKMLRKASAESYSNGSSSWDPEIVTPEAVAAYNRVVGFGNDIRLHPHPDAPRPQADEAERPRHDPYAEGDRKRAARVDRLRVIQQRLADVRIDNTACGV